MTKKKEKNVFMGKNVDTRLMSSAYVLTDKIRLYRKNLKTDKLITRQKKITPCTILCAHEGVVFYSILSLSRSVSQFAYMKYSGRIPNIFLMFSPIQTIYTKQNEHLE